MLKRNTILKLCKFWDTGRVVNNIKFLIKNDLREEWYRLKDETIEDYFYESEYLSKSLGRLQILDEKETISVLQEDPKSLSRFGDGEISIMRGNDTPFQKYYPELSEKMKAILSQKKENLYVGINAAYFQSPTKYRERNRKFYRLNATGYRRFFVDICDPLNVYLDAGAMGGYFKQKDDFDIVAHFNDIRNLFKGKNIAVVSGEGILDKLDYDVFDLCDNRLRIDAPKVDAFAVYDEIIDEIVNKIPKDYLICIILGMTATVLAADLADLGYVAWDLGHIAKEYDAYMKGIDKSDRNIKEFYKPD